ncbi:MAG: biotin/lipoyl-containing protein [Gemmatimonadaceae bacterium]
MRYVVTVGERRVTVDLGPEGATLDATTSPAAVADVGGIPTRVVTIGGEIHRVVVRRRLGRGRYVLWIDGFTYEVEALDERARAIRDLSGAATSVTGPASLLAPMPGLIVRVHVSPGDSVSIGQALVVMEAMKMENELRATAAGRVKIVRATVGAAVEKGATLVEME